MSRDYSDPKYVCKYGHIGQLIEAEAEMRRNTLDLPTIILFSVFGLMLSIAIGMVGYTYVQGNTNHATAKKRIEQIIESYRTSPLPPLHEEKKQRRQYIDDQIQHRI